MSEQEREPLLSEEGAGSDEERPSSQKSKASKGLKNSNPSPESTPLLSRDVDHRIYGDGPRSTEPPSNAASSLRSLQDGILGSKGRRLTRWTTVFAVTILCLAVIAILGLGFAAPAVVEQYAKDAAVFEPTNLSIDSFTSSGVRARVQGDFFLDASRVHKRSVRDLGRAGTWIARAAETKRSKVEVVLPEYENVVLGTADVPPVVVNIRNGHVTHLDFVTDLTAGDVDGIRRIAKDWLDGRLNQLRVQGKAHVGLKSGIFGFGTQTISKDMVFQG